jgi:glycosyltransferase involved in cell wall biosynthesis
MSPNVQNVPDSNAAASVSVILPVYNGSTYLREAIDCILAQTYANFELIIIDDGSTDNSSEIIAKYTDSRIKFYRQENQGLAATLNKGISLASGIYIARQDQDDVSLPERFCKQVEFLKSNPDYGMVGTWADIWTIGGPSGRIHKHPTESPLLKLKLLFTNPFVHSSIMMRKTILDEVGGYTNNPARHPPEDYELWSRIARICEVANIPESLVIYREVGGSMSRSADRQFWEKVVTIGSENIFHMLDKRCDLTIARTIVRLVHCVEDPNEQPNFRKITKMMLEIYRIMSKQYPSHRDSVRKLLKTYYHTMLGHYFAPGMNHFLRKLLVFFRSPWLFK